MNYIKTTRKSTAVTAAVVGNFRNPNVLDVIIAHIKCIRHYLVTPEGLDLYKEVPIFGRIATLNTFRLPGEDLDSVLLLTTKYHLAILSFQDGEIRTRAAGNVEERIGRPSETGIIACVHHSGLIALRLYEGLLKIIQWQDNRDLMSFNVRFQHYNITDFAFLTNEGRPTIGYFYQDHNGKHMSVCEIDLIEKELLPPLWNQENIEAEATLLIPIPNPYGGLVIVGRESISYHKGRNDCIAIAPPLMHMANFVCYGAIDKTGERFLLGDVAGKLFMLLLLAENKENEAEIKDLKLEYLGDISIPQCLAYLDNSVVYVGSKLGDSQLIRLSTEPVDVATNSFVEVVKQYDNLGPIRDMNGTLRVIRSGIGFNTIVSEKLKNIKYIFTLKDPSTNFDKYVVISMPDLTYLFLVDGEELESTHLPDFELEQSTLWAGNIGATTTVLQINPDGMRLFSGTFSTCTKWTAPSKISLCSVNAFTGQIILTSGANLLYLTIQSESIVFGQQFTCPNEIACVDISPLVLEEGDISKVFAVGFWKSHSVALYSIEPQIQQVVEENLTSDVLPRSILIISMEKILYLLVALGNGIVHHFLIDSEKGYLTESIKVTLGTVPTTLRKFSLKGKTNVFACSDRPTVIYSSNQKLAFSNVNLKTINYVAQLNSDFYNECLILSDGDNMIIGTIDAIQKLHHKTIPLGESVARIAYQAETSSIGILTERIDIVTGSQEIIRGDSISTTCKNRITQNTSDKSSKGLSTSSDEFEQSEVDVSSICILDSNTFQALIVYELNRFETALSICNAVLGTDDTAYFAVGTAFIYSNDNESKKGRILVFQFQPNNYEKLKLVAEKEVKGAVYSMATLGTKLVCTVNSSVRLFEWTQEKELRLECSHFNFITALYVKTKGDLVLCGDLMRSICLLQYNQADSSFVEVARDYAVNWMTACEIVDSETYMGAENNYNIICTQKDFNAENDEERLRLKQPGLFYLGEMINVFRQGTLITTQPDVLYQIKYTHPVMFATADGGLGLILQLPEDLFNFLLDLQKRIAGETHNCLRISHETYRNFCTEKRVEKFKGFVDGDLIESITYMPKETVQKIIQDLPVPNFMKTETGIQSLSVNDVQRLIEDLGRID